MTVYKHLHAERHRGLVPQDQLGTGSDGSGDHFLADDQTYKTVPSTTDWRGLAWKRPVRIATTASGTLATAFENGDSLQFLTLATGDRLLIKDQADPKQNGIYTVNASGAPTRATDADTGAELAAAAVWVESGTNAGTSWVCTTPGSITVGSTDLTFEALRTPNGLLVPGIYIDNPDRDFGGAVHINAVVPNYDPATAELFGVLINAAHHQTDRAGGVVLTAGDSLDDGGVGAYIEVGGADAGPINGKIALYSDGTTGNPGEVFVSDGSVGTWQAIDGGSP